MGLALRPSSESPRGNVLDLHRDDIAASQLAINGEIEHCQLAGSLFDLKLSPNGPDVPCQQQRFSPRSASPCSTACISVGVGSSCHPSWSSSELSEDDMVRRMSNALNYGSFREWCRHRLGFRADKSRCLCRVGPGNFTPSLSQNRT